MKLKLHLNAASISFPIGFNVMKTVSLIFLFAFLLALPGKGQFIDIKSPDISTFFVNAAMVSEDSLFFFPTSDSLLPNGKKRIPAYSKHKVVLNGQRQAIFDTTTIVKDSFEVITHHILTAKNSGRIEVGSIRHNDSNAFDSRIWIKTDQFPHYDSIQILPKIDTGNFFFRIFKAIPIKNQIYIFGDVAFNYFPFSKALALKYNLKTQQFTVNY